MTSSHIGLHQNVEMCFQEKATSGGKKNTSPPALVRMENLEALMVEELDFKTSMSPFFSIVK